MCVRMKFVSLCVGVTMSSIHVNAKKRTPILCNPDVILNANNT
jgi:hypothetical protein